MSPKTKAGEATLQCAPNGISEATKARNFHPTPELWITGLGSQYPSHLAGPNELESCARSLYGDTNAGINKLLRVNEFTGIETRAFANTFKSGYGLHEAAPTISEMDTIFRQAGVELAAQACNKAIDEWGGNRGDITHSIGVTCTNSGNPGYDLLVARKLGLRDDLSRMLLHGVGCAGGLAIMRTAAEIACGATARGRPACILAFACELNTLNVRRELDDAAKTSNLADICIAAALFGDGAAAFILCNQYAMKDKSRSLFQLVDWANSSIPNTVDQMGFYVGPDGFQTTLKREVSNSVQKAVKPLYEKLLPSFRYNTGQECDITQFDWALHPGGEAIIAGVQKQMELSNDQLRATKEVYKTRGNSSSPTVLIVLDKLRQMGHGRNNIVAASFGPGLAIEMAMLRRCRDRGTENAENGRG